MTFFFSFEMQMTENHNPETNWVAKLIDDDAYTDIYVSISVHRIKFLKVSKCSEDNK